MLRNQIFRVLCRTWSHNAALRSSAFSPVTRHKTTTHFANVLTATKARTQLRKVKLYTWVPLPPALTLLFLFLALLHCTKKSFSLLLRQTKHDVKVVYICVFMTWHTLWILGMRVCMYVHMSVCSVFAFMICIWFTMNTIFVFLNPLALNVIYMYHALWCSELQI